MATKTNASSQTGVEETEVQDLSLQPGVGDVALEGIRCGANHSHGEDAGLLGLYRKLSAISAAVDRIEKDKKNTQGNYEYASEKAIKECFHPLFVEHRLMLQPVDQTLIDFSAPAQGKSSYITTIKFQFAVVDLDTGARIPMAIIASGGDSLDKGTFKALTGAIKYLLTTMFLIPTGDDPEGDGQRAPRPAPQARSGATKSAQDPESLITEAQAKRMFALSKASGLTTEQLKALVSAAGYQSSKDIKVKDYDSLCAKIEAQK